MAPFRTEGPGQSTSKRALLDVMNGREIISFRPWGLFQPGLVCSLMLALLLGPAPAGAGAKPGQPGHSQEGERIDFEQLAAWEKAHGPAAQGKQRPNLRRNSGLRNAQATAPAP